MFVVFYNTNDVFIAEEKANQHSLNVEVVPTPVQDKAYCGVCLKVDVNEIEKIRFALNGMEFIEVENG